MKIAQRFLAAAIAAVMLLTAAPLTGLNLTAEAKSSASLFHTHKKVTSVKKATLSKNGAKTVTCSKCKKTLSKTTIYKIAAVKLKKTSYTYTGKAIKPAVVVKDSKGNTLKAGTDYTVTYKNNKAVGKGTVTVKFKGSYSGTKTLSFSIVPKITAKTTTSSVSVSWTKVSGAKLYTAELYSGKKLLKSVTATKTTSAKFTSLSANTSYTVRLTAKNGKKVLSSASITVKTAAKSSNKLSRTEKFNKTVSKGTYLLKFKTTDKELQDVLGDAPITVAMKNGNAYVEASFNGIRTKMLMLAPKKSKNNPTVYLVIDRFKVYGKMPASALGEDFKISSFSGSEKPVGKITVSKVKQGKKTLVCESYKTESGSKEKFWFDGDTPVKRETTEPDGTKYAITISKFTTKVSDSLFKIPDGYRYINLAFLDKLI